MIRIMMIVALAANSWTSPAVAQDPGAQSWIEIGERFSRRRCWESGEEGGNSSTRECETIRYVKVRQCRGIWRDPLDTRGSLADSTLKAETEISCSEWQVVREPAAG
jgi:hypothetical protein